MFALLLWFVTIYTRQLCIVAAKTTVSAANKRADGKAYLHYFKQKWRMAFSLTLAPSATFPACATFMTKKISIFVPEKHELYVYALK